MKKGNPLAVHQLLAILLRKGSNIGYKSCSKEDISTECLLLSFKGFNRLTPTNLLWLKDKMYSDVTAGWASTPQILNEITLELSSSLCRSVQSLEGTDCNWVALLLYSLVCLKHTVLKELPYSIQWSSLQRDIRSLTSPCWILSLIMIVVLLERLMVTFLSCWEWRTMSGLRDIRIFNGSLAALYSLCFSTILLHALSKHCLKLLAIGCLQKREHDNHHSY